MKNIIFLHIPKAAGNTIRAVAQRHFRISEIHAIPRNVALGIEAFKKMPEKKRAQFRFVKGHIMYGLHKWLPGESTYMTFLRDPVERTLSFWKFIKSNPDHPVNSVIDKDWKLMDFLKSRKTSQIENLQTVCLSGKALTSFDCSQDDFERACENLQSNFSAVGIVEKFDESIALCCAVFQWNDARWPPLNTSKVRMQTSQLTQEEHELILELNKWDVRIYNLAKSIQEKQVASNREKVDEILAGLANYSPTKAQAFLLRVSDSLRNRMVLHRSTITSKPFMNE